MKAQPAERPMAMPPAITKVLGMAVLLSPTCAARVTDIGRALAQIVEKSPGVPPHLSPVRRA